MCHPAACTCAASTPGFAIFARFRFLNHSRLRRDVLLASPWPWWPDDLETHLRYHRINPAWWLAAREPRRGRGGSLRTSLILAGRSGVERLINSKLLKPRPDSLKLRQINIRFLLLPLAQPTSALSRAAVTAGTRISLGLVPLHYIAYCSDSTNLTVIPTPPLRCSMVRHLEVT